MKIAIFHQLWEIISHGFFEECLFLLPLLFPSKFHLDTTWTLLHYSLCLQTSIFCFFASLGYILGHIFKVVFSFKHIEHGYFSFCIVQFQYLKSLWYCFPGSHSAYIDSLCFVLLYCEQFVALGTLSMKIFWGLGWWYYSNEDFCLLLPFTLAYF